MRNLFNFVSTLALTAKRFITETVAGFGNENIDLPMAEKPMVEDPSVEVVIQHSEFYYDNRRSTYWDY